MAALGGWEVAADCVALGSPGEEEAWVKELAKSILDTPTGLVGCFRPNLCSAPAMASEGAAAAPCLACKPSQLISLSIVPLTTAPDPRR